MLQKEIYIIPQFNGHCVGGQAMLNTHAQHASAMTELVARMRKDNTEGLDMTAIYKRYVEEHPEAYAVIKREFFTFTGKRVIVSEKNFYKWYGTTPEGQKYKASVEAISPSLYGIFTRAKI